MNQETLSRIERGWWWRRGGLLFRWVPERGAGLRGKTCADGLVVDFMGQKKCDASYFWDGLRFEEGAHLYEMARRGDATFAKLPRWDRLKPAAQHQLGVWARVRVVEQGREYDVWTAYPHDPLPLKPRAGWAVWDRTEWNLSATNAQLAKNFLELVELERMEQRVIARKGNEGVANNSLSWAAIEQLDRRINGARDGDRHYDAKAARDAEKKAKIEAAYFRASVASNGDAKGLIRRLFSVRAREI